MKIPSAIPQQQFLPGFQAVPKAVRAALKAVDRITLQTLGGASNAAPAARIRPKKVQVSRPEFTRRFIETVQKQTGQAPVTLLSGPRDRCPEQMSDIAGSLRTSPEYGVVLNASTLQVKGWQADDYREHWKEVRSALADSMRMVLVPGWESSPEAVADARHAQSLGIATLKVGIHDLDRTSIRHRLQESTAELKARGFETVNLADLLEGAIDESYLKDVATASFTSQETFDDPEAYVRSVVERTLYGRDDSDNDGARQAGRISQPEFTRLYVQETQKILGGRPMTYVSTPITGGRKKYDFLSQKGVLDKGQLDSQSKQEFVSRVIQSNTDRVFHVAEALRQEPGHEVVMDPAEITIPEWSQAQYSAHWDAVVQHLASRIVLVPDWHLSQGCVLELNRALSKGIPIQEIRVDRLAPSELRRHEQAANPNPTAPLFLEYSQNF